METFGNRKGARVRPGWLRDSVFGTQGRCRLDSVPPDISGPRLGVWADHAGSGSPPRARTFPASVGFRRWQPGAGRSFPSFQAAAPRAPAPRSPGPSFRSWRHPLAAMRRKRTLRLPSRAPRPRLTRAGAMQAGRTLQAGSPPRPLPARALIPDDSPRSRSRARERGAQLPFKHLQI